MSLGLCFFVCFFSCCIQRASKRGAFCLAEDDQVDSVTCQPALICAVSKGAFSFESSVSVMLCGSREALRPCDGCPGR